MKEETKRYYEFTFEQLKKILELKGELVVYNNKDDKGKESSILKIITIETKENK